MKVLFAVSNEEISESVVKKYQKQYKQIISYKNVYYFNAILKELQKDKSYDRIVISEDLEAFSHTQYDQIDKFIFDRLDSISDEAINLNGEDIPIIIICADRRAKSEPMLSKFFGIGIYNALLGNDRSVEQVCKLIKKPRVKREAKNYYKIESEEVKYQPESENDVSEVEIQNILAHFKRLGNNEQKYIESFDSIAEQYNDAQLKVICKFLPLNVRATLEEMSPRYQKLVAYNKSVSNSLRTKKQQDDKGTTEKLLKPKTNEVLLKKPVVIPSSVNLEGKKKLAKKPVITEKEEYKDSEDHKTEELKNIRKEENANNEVLQVEQQNNVKQENNEATVKPVKRGRGRPRKTAVENNVSTTAEEKPKRGRGRPRKNVANNDNIVLPEFENKTIDNSSKEEISIPGFEDYNNDDSEIISNLNDITQSEQKNSRLNKMDIDENPLIPGFDEDEKEETDISMPGFESDENQDEEDTIMPGFADDEEVVNKPDNNMMHLNEEPYQEQNINDLPYDYEEKQYQEPPEDIYNRKAQSIEKDNIEKQIDVASLLTGNIKLACFVGTSKNGTSFIVNNMAKIIASKGIDVAILDTTKNRNSYYIYTKNEEDLRELSTQCIENLIEGNAKGIQVEKNLTVYTALEDERYLIENSGEILQTLAKNHTVILIDCDFDTPINYFRQAQEIYLIQSLDVLTIQPLTAFLRELKAKNILDEQKLRIVLNKVVKVRGVNEKTIIGGMAFYNDPSMSFMTELFDRNLIKYISIPFDENVYASYLSSLIECEITLKGYPKNIMQSLQELANMIYPVASGKSTYKPPTVSNNGFSASINSTLDQMKKY